jgi:hypothetical protein
MCGTSTCYKLAMEVGSLGHPISIGACFRDSERCPAKPKRRLRAPACKSTGLSATVSANNTPCSIY